MTPTSRRFADDDRDLYDERGIIRDGGRIRVPMPMMDSKTGALVIETGLRGEFALSKAFFPNGESKHADAADVSSRRRRKTVERDPMGREVASFTGEDTRDAFSDHRPGYRGTTTAADHARVAAAYDEGVRELCDAWRTPEQRAQPVADARRTADPPPPEGVSAASWARHLTMVEDARAWMPDAGIEKEAAQAPKGIWPVGGVPVHLTAAKEGDLCGTDGARGWLARC